LRPIGWVHGGARCACRHRENRYRHLWAIRKHDGDAVAAPYPHGSERTFHIVDMLIETPVGQWSATRSENRRRLGAALGPVFQQVRQAQKRNRGPLVYEAFGRHVSLSPLELPQAKGFRI